MNLILFPPESLRHSPDGTAYVELRDPRRLRHLHEVHRATIGERYQLGEIDGEIGEGELLAFDRDLARFAFTPRRAAPQPLDLHLLLALPRPRMLARSLENIATLGVKRLTLLHTARVEKSYWQSPELGAEKIRQHLELGLEQARDTLMPAVELVTRFKPFLEDQLPALLEGRRGLVAHPGAAAPCPRGLPLDAPLLLAIGPEGGFIDYEVARLIEAGCEGIHLGERILRVETAVVALLSRLY